MFIFKYKYPQKFLDDLAKTFGFKWTPVKATTISKEKVKIQPLPPPSGTLYFMEVNYKTERTKKNNE